MKPKTKKNTGAKPDMETEHIEETATTTPPPAEPEAAEFLPVNLSVDEEGFPCLTLAQLYAWNVASLEAELSKVNREFAMVKRQLWLEQQAAYRKLTDDIGAATNAHEARSKELTATIVDLSEQLGFKLDGCTINDKTGRVTFVDQRNRPMLGRNAPPDHARLTKKT